MRERSSELSAAARALWLAELADALTLAQRLTWRLGEELEDSSGAMELYGRIEAALNEVQALRLGPFRAVRPENGPHWINHSPWSAQGNDSH